MKTKNFAALMLIMIGTLVLCYTVDGGRVGITTWAGIGALLVGGFLLTLRTKEQ